MASREQGGGALLDESHWIDQMIWLAGMPHQLSGQVGKISDLEIDSDDNVDILALYPDGLRISLHLDLYGRPHEKSIKFVGEGGTLRWEVGELAVGKTMDQEWERETFDNDRNDMFVEVAREFLRVIDGETAPSCTVLDGIRVMEIIEAVRAKHRFRRIDRNRIAGIMFKDKSVLAVVPARGGSKGIPKKNLRRLLGRSLIGMAGDVVQALPWVDRAIISTDDPAMAREGEAHGLEAPFLRPEELAADMATGKDAWKHAFLFAEAHYGMRFDISIYMEPTSPCRTPEDVERTVTALVDGGHMAAATVSRTPGSFTPHKTLTVDGDGHIGFYHPDGKNYSTRQKIPPYYHRNGICYAVFRETLLDSDSIIEERCAAVVIDRPVVNIDEPFDLELAEFILARSQADGAAKG